MSGPVERGDGMPVIGRWTLKIGGSDCPVCGNHYAPSRARCAVRHEAVDCVPRTVEAVPVAEVERLRRAFRRLYHHANGTWPREHQIEHWMDIGDADAF